MEKSIPSNIISIGRKAILPPSMKRESPQDYLNRIRKETGLTYPEMAARAKALGYKISAAYFQNVGSGAASNISIELMQAFAAGIGKPEDEVDAVFRGKQLVEETGYKESVFAILWNEYKALTPANQKETKVLIDVIHREIQRRLKT